MYSTPSNEPWPIRISTKSSSAFASRAIVPSVSRNCDGGGLRTAQRVDVRSLARGFEYFVQILRRGGEALLVVGLAAKAGDDDVVGRCARLQREERQIADEHEGALHTTPHLRRSSHSPRAGPRSSAKTMGIFQSSLVLRTEMPASE